MIVSGRARLLLFSATFPTRGELAFDSFAAARANPRIANFAFGISNRIYYFLSFGVIIVIQHPKLRRNKWNLTRRHPEVLIPNQTGDARFFQQALEHFVT